MSATTARGGWGEVPVAKRPPSVVVLGRAAFRVAVHGDSPNLTAPGAGICAPLDTAIALADLGVSTKVVAALGNDHLGRLLRRRLEDAGIEGESLPSRDCPTSLLLEDPGTHLYQGAGETLGVDDLPRELLGQAEHLHLDLASLATESVRAAAFAALELIPETAGISVEASPQTGASWSRYDAQGCLRRLLSGRGLLAFSAPRAPGLFPEFWTPDALAEGALDLGAAAVLIRLADDQLRIIEAGDTAAIPASEASRGPFAGLLARGITGRLSGENLAASIRGKLR